MGGRWRTRKPVKRIFVRITVYDVEDSQVASVQPTQAGLKPAGTETLPFLEGLDKARAVGDAGGKGAPIFVSVTRPLL